MLSNLGDPRYRSSLACLTWPTTRMMTMRLPRLCMLSQIVIILSYRKLADNLHDFAGFVV